VTAHQAAVRAVRTHLDQNLVCTRAHLPLMEDRDLEQIAGHIQNHLVYAVQNDYEAWEHIAALALAGMIAADRVEQGQPHTGAEAA
jgi:hypothetical protein